MPADRGASPVDVDESLLYNLVGICFDKPRWSITFQAAASGSATEVVLVSHRKPPAVRLSITQCVANSLILKDNVPDYVVCCMLDVMAMKLERAEAAAEVGEGAMVGIVGCQRAMDAVVGQLAGDSDREQLRAAAAELVAFAGKVYATVASG